MGLELDEAHSTPKLTLHKFPHNCKPRKYQPAQIMQTPPLLPSVSVPFRWEEAPGKPKFMAEPPPFPTTPPTKCKAARCLDLPPRLLHDDAKITIMPSSPSPTTVLDGPYVGRSLSLACTFSFRKGLEGPAAKRRCGSFRDDGEFVRGSFDFSRSLGDFFRREESVKVTRVKRRRSLFNLSTINSNLMADIYASFKQVVPWRRNRR